MRASLNISYIARHNPCAFIARILTACVLMFSIQTSRADSATWSASPTSSDWNTALNWTPATVPNGAADVATFGLSTITQLSFSANTQVSDIVFNPGASSFTIALNSSRHGTVDGEGITNNSAILQNFVIGTDTTFGLLDFTNSATAGTHANFTVNGGADAAAGL